MQPAITIPIDVQYLAGVNGIGVNGRSDHGDGYSYGPIEDRPGHEIYIKGGDALDVYAAQGTAAHGGISGAVTEIGIDKYGTYYVIIEGPEGKTVDAHLDNLTVGTGDTVQAGQVIGYISGKLNYPHIHAERQINGRSLMAVEILANLLGGEAMNDQMIIDLFWIGIGRKPREDEIIARRGQTYETVRNEMMHTNERFDRIRDDGYEALLGRAGTKKDVEGWRDSDKPLLLIFEEIRQSKEGKAYAEQGQGNEKLAALKAELTVLVTRF